MLSTFQIYERLYEQHGPQRWWPADTALEVMVGAVLVQATAWTNAAAAIANLERSGALSASAIREMPIEDLEILVRPSGFFRAKARKLKALCEFLNSRYADDIDAMSRHSTDTLRVELLSVYGVGEETADDILLYALGHPVFVVDAFTQRLFYRLGMCCSPKTGYRRLQHMFHASLPADVELFGEYHALIVRHGNSVCKTRPNCGKCALSSICPQIGVRPEN